MQLRSSNENYGLIARALHWLIALSMITLLGLGWWMVGLDYFHPWYHRGLQLHKSLGLLLLCIVILKFLWQLQDHMPAQIFPHKAFERHASRAAHLILRLAMLLIPLSGYIISTSENAAIEVFDWFSVPPVMPVNTLVRDSAITVHYYLAYTTLLIVLLHIAGALKHQFIDHEDIIGRMLWKW